MRRYAPGRAHGDDGGGATAPAPGKLTRSEAIQRKATSAPAPSAAPARVPIDAMAPFWFADDHAAADHGVAGAANPLPFGDTIQAAFGAHDVSGVQAHVGGAAADASRALGAHAYATGKHVAFAGAPDLHTAAHEAAHVVQQRGGVQLAGGLGVDGDAYERQADAVADRVVAGQSAADLLGPVDSGGSGDGAAVQRYQRYRVNEQLDDLWPAGQAVRVSEDGRLAVGDKGYGSHDLWADASLIGPANATLGARGSPYALAPGTDPPLVGRAPNDDTARTLTKVVPKHLPTDATGDALEMPDDCGDAAHEVTGAQTASGKRGEMVGVYRDVATRLQRLTAQAEDIPTVMKREIVMPFVHRKSEELVGGVLGFFAEKRNLIDLDEVRRLDQPILKFRQVRIWYADHVRDVVRPLVDRRRALMDLDPGGDAYQREVAELEVADQAAEARGEKLKEVLEALVPAFADNLTKIDKLLVAAYQRLSSEERDAFERAAEIDRCASPEPGEAFAIATGGAPRNKRKADHSIQITYNVHWAAVIMKSGGDTVTMENSAQHQTERNTNWIFQMYGAASDVEGKRGQTFHEQNRDHVGAHGASPTTMVVRPK